MATDDLHERLQKVIYGAVGHQVDDIVTRVEAVARAHASGRVESFTASAAYCPFCGVSADEPEHRRACPLREEEP